MVASSAWRVCVLTLNAAPQTEFLYKNKPKPAPQFSAIEKDGTPFAVIIAPEEWAAGSVRVKEQKGKESGEAQGNGELVKLDDLAAYLKSKLQS